MAIVAHRESVFQKSIRAIPLPDVIQRYCPGLELRRQGQNLRGLCPFHEDKSPSFTVSPEKNLFYCFGCSVGGGAVAFVARLLRLSLLEAARTIARDFGLAVNEQPLSKEARRRLAEARRRAELEEAIVERLEVEINRTHQAVCLLLRTVTATMARALEQRDVETVENLADLIRWLPWLDEITDRLYDPDPEKRLVAWEEAAKWIS